LWEGEGTFYVQTCKSGHRKYLYARASLTLGDVDVLNRLRAVIEVGSIKPRLDKARKHPRRLLLHELRVDAQAEVHALADLLYPWLGVRRRAQIDDMRVRAVGRIAA
jgi:hypothetical protein